MSRTKVSVRAVELSASVSMRTAQYGKYEVRAHTKRTEIFTWYV